MPVGTVDGKFEEIYKHIRNIAEVPGFRKGKAPKDIIEKKYTHKAQEEVLKDLISDSYHAALKELKIVPVGFPEIVDVTLDRHKPLKYKAELDVRPDVHIKKYKGLKLKKDKTEVKDSDVEKSLDNLREFHAKFASADDRSVGDGDYIICDLACSAQDKEIFKKNSMWLLVNKEGTIAELHNGVVGMKKDEEKNIPAKLPKDYPDKNLAEKEVVYKIRVKHVKEKRMPPLDDAFAKDLGKPTVAELKEAVKGDLLKRTELAVKEGMRSQVMQQLIDGSSFDVPESMTERQVDSLVNDARDRLLSQGVEEKEIEQNIDAIKDKMKPRAVNQVKAFFLLGEIAKSEKIKVEAKEVDRAVEILAAQLKKDKKKLLEEYRDKNLLEQIIGQIQEEKTMEFLLKEAEVREK